VIPGLEPQQRFPQARPQGDFGGRGRENRENHSRDRKFGGPRAGYANASGFNDRGPARGHAPSRGFQGQGQGQAPGQGQGQGRGRDEAGGYGRKSGWGDSAPRAGAGAPRGNGGAHGAGKAFAPRDGQRRAFKPTR
jgi:hypothetical protein